MNSKKRDFLISISVIFIFCLAIVLYLNYFLLLRFQFSKEIYLGFMFLLLFIGLVIFLSFSLSLIKLIFKSDEKLEENIKNTLHELNIPASTIKMNVQLLEKSITNEKDLARLDRIKKANENLLKLYENMEYELKKEIDRIEKEEFYLDEILQNSLLKFEDIKKDTVIEFEVPRLLINSDYNGFMIALDNLISNAIKYNDEKKPYIKIDYKDDVLSIFNSGRKIEAKNIIMVFDRYFQTNSLSNGFGLGLAIVKEFCDKNSILINIETLENGNRFNLNLKNILI